MGVFDGFKEVNVFIGLIVGIFVGYNIFGILVGILVFNVGDIEQLLCVKRIPYISYVSIFSSSGVIYKYNGFVISNVPL